jgi:hypothetical protein
MLNKIWNWLVLSSADENKVSATVKGSAAFIIVSVIAQTLGIDGVSEVADHGVSLLVEFVRFVSALYLLYGGVRKVAKTALGSNRVLNNL